MILKIMVLPIFSVSLHHEYNDNGYSTQNTEKTSAKYRIGIGVLTHIPYWVPVRATIPWLHFPFRFVWLPLFLRRGRLYLLRIIRNGKAASAGFSGISNIKHAFTILRLTEKRSANGILKRIWFRSELNGGKYKCVLDYQQEWSRLRAARR